MEYLLTYSSPQAARAANDWLVQMPDQVLSHVEGSTVIVRPKGEMDINDVAWLVLGNREPFRSIDPLLRLNYPSALFGRFWPSGLFSDLTLRVGNRDFRVHRLLLAAVSDYFYSLLTNFRQAGDSVIALHEVDPDLFSDLLRLIYGGTFLLKGVRALELLILVKFFQITTVDLDRYLQEMRSPPVEEIYQYLVLLNQLYSTGFSEEALGHLQTMVDDYYNDDDIDNQEVFRTIWPLLPESVKEHNEYVLEEKTIDF